MAWPTNIQSKTPDGKFGPARMMAGWGDCWFLAPLAAVANDPDGHKILAESIKTVDGGYEVTFKGSPHYNVFISDSELNQCVEERGGDADTRLMELAADKFFNENGRFQSLYIAHLMVGGASQEKAEHCLRVYCQKYHDRDPMTYNPMRGGAPTVLAFFMFTGKYPNFLAETRGTTMQESDVMLFLNRYITNDRDGAPVEISGVSNPLGNHPDLRLLVHRWDVMRTEITANGTLSPQQREFLNALARWLKNRMPSDMQKLEFAARNLQLQLITPANFVDLLNQSQFEMNPKHFNLLRSGVQQVLDGKSGYIGFCGGHAGNIEGINKAAGTFTYSEPNRPTLVHTGELSDLIQAILSGNVFLSAFEPTTKQDDKERFEHASTSRGRRLLELHNQVVRDGKIDLAESGALADLLEMDDGTFRQLYDSDKNGVIEGHELKAVQLRVNRWVEHLKFTPIW